MKKEEEKRRMYGLKEDKMKRGTLYSDINLFFCQPGPSESNPTYPHRHGPEKGPWIHH